MKGKRLVTMICCGVTVLVMTGCGSRENITLGMQQIRDLNYQVALECFAQAEAAGESDKLIARGRGIACMGLMQYEEAEKYFLQALGCSKGIIEDVDYDINLYLAAVYTKQAKYVQAKEVYDSILALRPKDENVLFLRGNACLKLDEYELAKQDMNQVVTMAPKDFERIIKIHEAFVNVGYRDAGQEYLITALQNYEKEMSNFDRGRMYFYMEDYQKAYLALEEAKDEGKVEAYLYLGMAYEATGDYNYASSVYNSYLTKMQPDAKIYNQLGLCEMKKGEYQKALEAFQAGIQMDGKELMQSLLFNEIAAYEYLGDFSQAKILMTQYLAMYPDDEQAVRENSFLSSR